MRWTSGSEPCVPASTARARLQLLAVGTGTHDSAAAAPLTRLAAQVRRGGTPTGDATLVLRTRSYPDRPSDTGYELYLDNGSSFYADTATGLPAAIAQGRGENTTGGFRYDHDSAFERVVLIPHLAGAPAILLAEHRSTYLIAYPVGSEADFADALHAIGRALDDASRVAILAHLRNGEATLTDLADGAGIAKSTAHHHLVQLRAARLITIRGNSRGRTYKLDARGIDAAVRLLGSIAPT